MKLIDDFPNELKRLWSLRVAYFWTAVGTIAALWTGLAGTIPTWLFFGGGFVVIFSFSIARVLKQPGTDQ